MDRLHIYYGQLGTFGFTWNHAKIVAADGRVAIVGGHNLWWEPYGQYPPVHDISVRVDGPAARDAQLFAERLWTPTKHIKLNAWTIDADYTWRTVTPHRKRWPSLSVDRGKEAPHAPEHRDTERSARILSLPRALHLDVQDSDDARYTVIQSAERSLYICQQDLVFHTSGGDHRPDRHYVCQVIAGALASNPALEVNIVVSPRYAGGNGEPYSYGAGSAGTYNMILYFLAKLGREADGHVLDRLHVAPFFFTHDVWHKGDDKTKNMTEGTYFDDHGWDGTKYVWPEAKIDTMYYEEGSLAPVQRGYARCQPAPANHAKFYMADETACYVGSDNMYPHPLVEFGYLIEGPVVKSFVRDYWNNVWGFSKRMCAAHRGTPHASCQK